MKVIVDLIIYSLQKSGGISVYWCEIITKILNNPKYSLFFIEKKYNHDNFIRQKLNIDKLNLISEVGFFIESLNRFKSVNLKLNNQKFIFHSTYYRSLSKLVKNKNKVKEVVTVHDFTHELFSKGIRKWIHIWQKKKAIQSADIVICISENTKKDLLYFYPKFSKKDIRVIYNGVSLDYYRKDDLRYVDNSEPFILFVGSRVNYKNFIFTVKAIAQTNEFLLNIVGPGLTNNEILILNKYLPGRWKFSINILNTELNILYNTSFALVYPSSYEGFGIPIVEAMRAGCPFIALNCSSIPEIAGNAGVLMEKLDLESFNSAILTIKYNREIIINNGLNQAIKFSWEKCSNEILGIYEELYNDLN
jgi:mannosyltransferase